MSSKKKNCTTFKLIETTIVPNWLKCKEECQTVSNSVISCQCKCMQFNQLKVCTYVCIY